MNLFKKLAKIFSNGDGEQAPERYPARNELCWCGSGMKYKKCHLAQDEKKVRQSACCIKS